MCRTTTVTSLFLLFAAPALAGEADVLKADVACDHEMVCSFSVTVRHADEGWNHYADKWEVLDPGGELVAVRKLAHPHESEQPFTRSLAGVQIPDGVDEVTIRAHDSKHGYGGRELVVRIPR